MTDARVVIPAEAVLHTTPAEIQRRQSLWTPAFAGATVLIGCLLPFRLFADDLAENQARFGRVTGEAQILPQGAADWLDAEPGLPIETGDQIRVGDDGEAELSIAANALWVAQNNSHLIVGHHAGQDGRLTLTQGGLIGKVNPMNGRTGDWRFETPTAVCAVRGTEFILVYGEDAGTQLGVVKGVVEMRPAESATESLPPVLVYANEEGVLKKRMPLRKLSAFGPELHARLGRMAAVRRRFHEAGQVWSPFTREYRRELRHKRVPPAVKKRSAPPPRAVPRRRRPPQRG